MGMIKLPNKSINFYKENIDEIFDSGMLAEGKWNKEIGEWACSYTSAPYGLAVNSNGAGIFALLNILKNFDS